MGMCMLIIVTIICHCVPLDMAMVLLFPIFSGSEPVLKVSKCQRKARLMATAALEQETSAQEVEKVWGAKMQESYSRADLNE